MSWFDMIDSYMDLTEGRPSPDLFRKWAAISMVAASLERRVWTKINKKSGPIYPNLWVLLVAPPGVGKGEAITTAANLMRETKKFFLSPDSVTSASLVDAYINAFQARTIDSSTMIEYHSLFACLGELGFFMSEWQHDFMSRLITLYDNPPEITVQRVYLGSEPKRVVNPQLNFLAGTQPGFLASLIPDSGWSTGLMARFVMVYSAVQSKFDLDPFADGDVEFTSNALYDRLLDQLLVCSSLYGQMLWERQAGQALINWHRLEGAPAPKHSRLLHYNARRTTMTITKLAMVSAVSRTGQLGIDLEDFQRAQSWLLEAESVMPDIFRDMQGKSDNNVLVELHYSMMQTFTQSHKPIHEEVIWRFLSERAPSQVVPRLMEMARLTGIIVPQGDGLYIPKPIRKKGLGE